MMRLLIAGLLSATALAAVSPTASAAPCEVNYQYIEDVGLVVDCGYIPFTPYDCYIRGPGYWMPEPDVRCAGVELPPDMATLCEVSLLDWQDLQAHCWTGGYTGGTADCDVAVATGDPLGTTAGCDQARSSQRCVDRPCDVVNEACFRLLHRSCVR